MHAPCPSVQATLGRPLSRQPKHGKGTHTAPQGNACVATALRCMVACTPGVETAMTATSPSTPVAPSATPITTAAADPTLAIQPMPELAPLLKRLRLSGILETLPTRNREAINGKLAYTEFLALLIQDEVARREQKKFALRVRRAGFRSQKTLTDFDFAFNVKVNQALILDLATCRFVEEKAPVLIAGPCGTGKSHIAQALGHEAAKRNYDVIFTTQRRLMASLHAARATNTYERRFHSLVKAPLLIVDDFGLKPLLPPADEDFHELVSERYERVATIVTSNLLCGAPHKRFNAESRVMRGPFVRDPAGRSGWRGVAPH